MIVGLKFPEHTSIKQVCQTLEQLGCKGHLFYDGLLAVEVAPTCVETLQRWYESGVLKNYKIGITPLQIQGVLFQDGD